MLPLKEISLTQPPHSKWKSETCPSLGPAVKGQVKKAENALPPFCFDMIIWEQTPCSFCLHLFIPAARKEQGPSLTLMGGEAGAPLDMTNMSLKWKQVIHLLWLTARTSFLPSPLCLPWSGCCSAAEWWDDFSFIDTDAVRAVNHDLWHVSSQNITPRKGPGLLLPQLWRDFSTL